MSECPKWMKELPPEFWVDREVLDFVESWRKKQCDMMYSPICIHYQRRLICHYGKTHGVEKCPYGKRLRYEGDE